MGNESAHLANITSLFIELGAVIIGLSILARLALRVGLTPIPLYLIAGLCFGAGGALPLHFSNQFITTGAEIGVILLLFMLGLEYTGEELAGSLRRGLKAGALNTALNFTPGFLFGLLLGWPPLAALLLGGVTWLSSSSIIAKVLGDLDRLGNRETPTILSILVLEDLSMAVYLPLVAVLLLGQGFAAGALSIFVALSTVMVVLFLAVRQGPLLSRAITHASDEVVLLTVFGLILIVAGVAQQLQVSSGVGAFLVGLALSGAVADRAHGLLGPLRDLFAATFFFFVGLQVNPKTLVPALAVAFVLALITAGTKWATGWLATGWEGIGQRGRMRAGTVMMARGEFSVVIAGLGTSVEPRLAPVAAAYVLILAVCGPIATRYAETFSAWLETAQERAARRADQQVLENEEIA